MRNSTNEYEVSILVNGRSIPEVHHNGRTYVEGRKNSRYSLQIRNNSAKRILVIPSVDGLNVLDGQDCGLESPGYVIEAWNTVEIPGWKVAGESEAGRFVFTPQGAKYYEEETYAESMGLNPTNQGTIGFMVFREKEDPYNILISNCSNPNPWQPPVLRPLKRGCFGGSKSFGGSSGSGEEYTSGMTHSEVVADSVTVAANAASVDERHMGTGWGESVDFFTHDVEFERANPSVPDAVFVYQYDTIRNLKRLGVPTEQFYGHSSSPTEANPFPASPHVHSSGGCQPPPGWRGKKRGRR